MPILTAQLLGPPRFLLDGRPVPLSASKLLALWCYLVATRQVHSRDRLAAFFWPEVSERSALASLRTSLYDLRRALGPQADAFLYVERTRVAFRAESDHELDIARLERIGAIQGEADEATLRAAIDAYGGEFLEGLSAPDSCEFDDWVFLERERLAQLYLSALCRLSRLYADAGAHERAIDVARRVIAEDPLREDMHRALMVCYARAGQRTAALAQYRACAELLERELGIQPLDATTELMRRIAANEPLGEEVDGPTPVARAAAARQAAVPADPIMVPGEPVVLVGRAAERAALRQAWQRTATDGGGQVVVVAGESGLGKTTLVRDLLRDLAPGVALVGRCYESTVNESFGPLVEPLRQALSVIEGRDLGLSAVWWRELARLLPELEAELPAGPSVPLDGGRERERLFEAVEAFLAAVAAVEPVLLVVEDAQWSDDTSLVLLADLSRKAARHRWLILVTHRTEGLAPARRAQLAALAAPGGQCLELRPLRPDDTAELVMAISGGAIAPERFGLALHRHAGGNPFFAVELLRALVDQGTLRPEPGGWTSLTRLEADDYARLPMPASLGLILDARLERLTADARTLLETAAVLRRDFAFDVVQAASGLPAPVALDALDGVLSQGLLQEVADPPGQLLARYDFVHTLVRERLYGGMSAARRQYVHRQVAGLLEAAIPVVPERVAYHTLRGGVRDRAGLWSARSGEAALRIYGFAEAVSHFGLARELATTPADELAALSGLGDALVGLGRPEEAVGRLTAALPLAPDDETKADLWRRIGRAHERQGAYDRALEAFSAAQGLLDEHPMSLATLLAADGLATVNLRLGRHEEAARVSSEGLSWLADQTTLDARSREQAESWLRNTLGMAEMQAADYAGALEQLTLGLALKRRVGDRLGEATLLNNIGVVHYHCGDDEPARDHYAASLAIKEEIGDRYGRAIALTNLALVETHLGDLAAASAHLAAAAADAERVTAQWLQPEIQRVRAQLALAMAEPAAALAAANAALEVAEELAVPAHIGVAHRVMGRVTAEALGDPQAADEHFQTSLAVFEMLENEHELAKTRVAYGRMLAAEGRGEDAAAQLRWAREVFRRSGAQGRLRQVDHLLSEASDPR